MKSNKEIIYDYIVAHSNDEKNRDGFSTQELSKVLGLQRSNLSSILNSLVKENRMEKISGRPVLYRLINLRKDESCFRKLIGFNGSLENAICLAKAAILYPEHSLPTLIIGPGGSGKSTFGRIMYEFAIENCIIEKNSPFVTFNCRNFEGSDERELKLNLIGDETQRDCALTHAKGGVLLIDHINLLPATVRNTFLESMKQYETDISDTIIICTVSDLINKALDDALTSKFPVKINLPSLQKRKMEERLTLIQEFFNSEALKMKRIIRINSELLRCILLYNCEGNIKQLKTDIKIGCANAYAREFNTEVGELHVYINDFANHIRKGFLFYKENREEVERLIPEDYSYTFSSEKMRKEKDTLPQLEVNDTIYDVIDRKAEELRARGIIEEDINMIVGADIESDLQKITKRITEKGINRESLSKIVDTRIIQMVDDFLEEASKRFGRVYPASTFYGLCLHLSATIERANKEQWLSNSKIMEVVEKHKDEYTFCISVTQQWEKEFDIRLPIDEVIFITRFICNKSTQNQTVKKPVILVAMHGNSTASSIAEVVNDLMKSDNIYSYDMSLDNDVRVAYDELKTRVQQIDQGKGVLLLYDMGSLKQMGEMVMQETGVNIRMIEIPATLIALDCSRKASISTSLDEVYDDLIESFKHKYSLIQDSYQRQLHKSVIITLCMSGQGGAIQIKQYLEKNVELENVDILPYAISDMSSLLQEVNKLKKDHNIQCVIGTYNPKLHGIPFIPISKIFETPTEKLPMLLTLEHIDSALKVDYEAMYKYLSEQMPLLNIKIIKKYLPKAIAKMKKVYGGLSQDQELGLFIHIACSIYRIQTNEKLPVNINRRNILSKNKILYNNICDILEELEDVCDIKFSDDEIANIISIIKQI